MVDQLRAFAAEVTRVAREVGTEGKLGGQAEVEGVSGTWRDLTENVNFMASNLTDQVRDDRRGHDRRRERRPLEEDHRRRQGRDRWSSRTTINTMVDQLSSFAAEVTRVAREVGTEGKLGGQAEVAGVSGTWRGPDREREPAGRQPHRPGAQHRRRHDGRREAATSPRRSPSTRRARSLELKETINTMVDQLSTFADEVTRVAQEVGTEGKLGGQAAGRGRLRRVARADREREPARANLTTQVRAIAEVSTAVTQGDLTRSITVEAGGEVADLKDNINQMIANLRETTRAERRAGLAEDEPRPLLGDDAGPARPEDGLAPDHVRADAARRRRSTARSSREDTTRTSRLELRLIASYGYKERKSIANRFSSARRSSARRRSRRSRS